MLSIRFERRYPKYMECGHWSYWLTHTETSTVCEACKRKYPKQVNGDTTKDVKLLEYVQVL